MSNTLRPFYTKRNSHRNVLNRRLDGRCVGLDILGKSHFPLPGIEYLSRVLFHCRLHEGTWGRETRVEIKVRVRVPFSPANCHVLAEPTLNEISNVFIRQFCNSPMTWI
jgi:hypothetical protein